MIKLDYTLDSPQDRLEIVNKFLEENPKPDSKTLELLADYLVFCMEKQEKKEKKILTENRLATVNKREVSYEGLMSKFENGEDGVYNLTVNDKHVIFQPKKAITAQDRADIPDLQQTDEAIAFWSEYAERATGKDAFIAKRALIESRKDQYVIKEAFKPVIKSYHLSFGSTGVELPSDEYTNTAGEVGGWGATFLDPEIVSTILCNYSKLQERAYDTLGSDLWYLMIDFDRISGIALKNYPIYYKIVEGKIDGLTNVQIQQNLIDEFGQEHSVEYISSLWRNKIPALISSVAEDEYLSWYYLEVKKGKYKKCSRCGEVKLAHNKYFSKNSTSRDGFYSICKECRNKGSKKHDN